MLINPQIGQPSNQYCCNKRQAQTIRETAVNQYGIIGNLQNRGGTTTFRRFNYCYKWLYTYIMYACGILHMQTQAHVKIMTSGDELSLSFFEIIVVDEGVGFYVTDISPLERPRGV